MRVSNEKLSDAVSMAASFNSSPLLLNSVYCLMIQAVVTVASSLNGTFKIQISADPSSNPQPNSVSNWTDYPNSTQTITANGNYAWDITVTGANWLRVVWTSTAGTGTTTIRSNTKGV